MTSPFLFACFVCARSHAGVAKQQQRAYRAVEARATEAEKQIAVATVAQPLARCSPSVVTDGGSGEEGEEENEPFSSNARAVLTIATASRPRPLPAACSAVAFGDGVPGAGYLRDDELFSLFSTSEPTVDVASGWSRDSTYVAVVCACVFACVFAFIYSLNHCSALLARVSWFLLR